MKHGDLTKPLNRQPRIVEGGAGHAKWCESVSYVSGLYTNEMARPKGFEPLTPRFVV
jgi:hypothetical protein